jgi:hypothetical protein
VAWGSHEAQRIAAVDASDGRYWGLARGGDGTVYALIREAVSLKLVQIDLDGKPRKTWNLTRFLPDFESGDFIAVDALGRVFCAQSISADSPWDPPDHWGYVLRAYVLVGETAQRAGAAEVRYGPGDMEGYPGLVSLGDRPPLTVDINGSVILRAATSKEFRLKSYPPPPWMAESSDGRAAGRNGTALFD